MADGDVIQTIVTALENRVNALTQEAHALLLDGEVDYAKIKTALGAELGNLKNEITNILEKI
jgi:hypothetical protein